MKKIIATALLGGAAVVLTACCPPMVSSEYFPNGNPCKCGSSASSPQNGAEQ